MTKEQALHWYKKGALDASEPGTLFEDGIEGDFHSAYGNQFPENKGDQATLDNAAEKWQSQYPEPQNEDYQSFRDYLKAIAVWSGLKAGFMAGSEWQLPAVTQLLEAAQEAKGHIEALAGIIKQEPFQKLFDALKPFEK